jgi:hypothetical protein
MLTDLKTLIERFANSTSSDDLFDSINAIYRDAEKDPELKKWFKSIDAYIRKCLREQGYIMQDSATEEWNVLYDKGNYLLRDRYRTHTNRIVDESKFIADQFDADPQNKAFANSLNKLFNDLGNDENGKPTFKPHLLKDLSNVILPALFEHVSYVPIPRIEYSDPMMDAVVENLIVESDNLMPNIFEVVSDNYFRWGRKENANKNKNKVEVGISGVQMDLKGISNFCCLKQTRADPLQMSAIGLRRSKDSHTSPTPVSSMSSWVDQASASKLRCQLRRPKIEPISSRSTASTSMSRI